MSLLGSKRRGIPVISMFSLVLFLLNIRSHFVYCHWSNDSLMSLQFGLCSPIFAEIVPEKSRASVYALDRSFESILSSFAPPIVGILAQQVYGYKQSSADGDFATNRENAVSLGKALYAAIGIPMTLCCLIYSFLYFTYPRDRERARMEALIESEMQRLSLDDNRESTHSKIMRSDDAYIVDRSVMDIDYGDEDQDHNESDESDVLFRQLTFSNMGE